MTMQKPAIVPGAAIDQNQKNGYGVSGVIEKITVARALDAAKAGETSIEGIAEPVNEKSDGREPKKSRIKPAADITCQDDDGTGDADRRQRIGRYGIWHMGAQPIEDGTLGPG